MLPIATIPSSLSQLTLGFAPPGTPTPVRLTFAELYQRVIVDLAPEGLGIGDLTHFTFVQLSTIDSEIDSRVKQLGGFANRQKADPKFKLPQGTPDVDFRGAVSVLEKFQDGTLKYSLDSAREKKIRAERPGKAPDLIKPWMSALRKRWPADEPILTAIEASRTVAEEIVYRTLADASCAFTDEELVRWGYLTETPAWDELRKMKAPSGDKGQASIKWFWRMLNIMRAHELALPVTIANAFLKKGKGDPADPTPFLSLVTSLDKDIRWTINRIQQQQVSPSPFSSGDTSAMPGNGIWYWIDTIGNDPDYKDNSVYGSYTELINSSKKPHGGCIPS